MFISYLYFVNTLRKKKKSYYRNYIIGGVVKTIRKKLQKVTRKT